MADKTKIGWTDATINPVTGCSWASVGCDNCYAKPQAKRLQAMGQENYRYGFDRAWHPHVLKKPFEWKRPRRIFVCSMSDLFHHEVPFSFISAVFGAMAGNPQHTFQLLSKRPERMREFFVYHRFHENEDPSLVCSEELYALTGLRGNPKAKWPLPNVWLGVTAENQETADERIPILLDVPAVLHFVSVEPMLSPIKFSGYTLLSDPCFVCKLEDCFGEERGTQSHPINCKWKKDRGDWYARGIGWVICGGESGPKARPMDPQWARSLRDQCIDAGTPFFMKQMSKRAPIPDDLDIKEFPL